MLLDSALAALLCVGLLWADVRSGAHHATDGEAALRTAGIVLAAFCGAPQVSVCVALGPGDAPPITQSTFAPQPR
ncbi:hypothetical protein SAMN06272735_0206 [Streptomyces sp. TLI_55]|uniref:hypothetical protein n=1 Tax=Streptomyces sp. TLI_55 TaxID=1938861 RepID=UPI000BD885F8|nr:hypothetical protein [Streptomyces sp. TLI_55]SNX55775.1 hypothetical protein SAMN06272735_0206 [Streptomyces sp. TLI_55]